jgi:hypothetical protein
MQAFKYIYHASVIFIKSIIFYFPLIRNGYVNIIFKHHAIQQIISIRKGGALAMKKSPINFSQVGISSLKNQIESGATRNKGTARIF